MSHTLRFFCIGDSLINGNTGGGDPFPILLRDDLGAEAYDVHNYGWGSQTLTGGSENITKMARLFSRWRGVDVVLIHGGVNDIASGQSAATIFARLEELYQEAKNDGMYVIAGTIFPWKDSGSWTAGFQTVTDTLNTSILGSTIPDVIIDFYDHFEDPSNADEMNTLWRHTDLIHLNSAGKIEASSLITSNLGTVQSEDNFLDVENWSLGYCSFIFEKLSKATNFTPGTNFPSADNDDIKGVQDWAGRDHLTQNITFPLWNWAAYNGLPSLEFDGTKYLNVSSPDFDIAIDDDLTIWFAAQFNSAGTQVLLSKHDGSTGWELRYEAGDIVFEMQDSTGTRQRRFTADFDTDVNFGQLESDGVNAAGITLRRNGTTVVGSTDSDSDAGGSIANAAALTLGADPFGLNGLNGDFFFVVVAKDLTSGQKSIGGSQLGRVVNRPHTED